MSAAETVTVGVPVYLGDAFIEETLGSIRAQTHRAFEVIISLDGPQPATEALCRPFLSDSRFRLVTQPQRLGWVGNLNWLMAQAGTAFWCYQQQDDLMDPRYLEVLVAQARSVPQAAVCYCDMEAFGTMQATFVQSPVTGSASARQLALLFEHLPAVAFRGLTRVEALRLAGGVPANEIDSFGCDTAWMAAVARWGELWRVPQTLYRKRYHAGNEHMKWYGWPLEKRVKAWIAHCAVMLEQAMLVSAPPHERRMLWLAAVVRLIASHAAHSYLPIAGWTAAERAALLATFCDHVAGAGVIDLPALLHDGWDEIEAWTKAVALAPV